MNPAASIFDQIYEKYSAKICNYFQYRTHNIWDAEDLTTTVFLKVYVKYGQYNSKHPFEAWLYRIARNTYIDYLRKKRDSLTETGECSELVEEVLMIPEQELLRSETKRELLGHLDKLTTDQQNVISLRYYIGLKMREIAQILGKKEESVKVIHHRGMKQLKKQMASLG